jgi:hypothetical protein
LFFKILLQLAYRDLRIPQRCWRHAGDMASRLKAGSPCYESGKIGIKNWEDLEEAVLVLEKLGRKPLIMRRLFSYWRNGGCSQQSINSSSAKRNGAVTGMQNLNSL